jgi:hypothetical protein
MAKARVYLETTISYTTTVDVPDDVPEDERDDYARDRAAEEMPSGICASCTGWGQKWSKDEGEYEPIEGDDVEWID